MQQTASKLFSLYSAGEDMGHKDKMEETDSQDVIPISEPKIQKRKEKEKKKLQDIKNAGIFIPHPFFRIFLISFYSYSELFLRHQKKK